MTYTEKLKDPRWQRKRLTIFERDEWRCCACHRADKNLQVHHLIYARCDPWEYPDHVFQTLCADCHEERQELTDKAANALRLALKNIPTERLPQVAQRLCKEALDEI